MGVTAQVHSNVEQQTSNIVSFEAWLDRNARIGAAIVLLGAFAVRFYSAWGTFFNPDEALHFRLANHFTWTEAYHASLSSAHPPGLIFVLYFWRALGTSEIVLRLPSIIAGTAFCWLVFAWVGKIFGAAASWVSLLLAAFLPPMIELSSQVRQYALLLFFIGAALYFFELAVERKSLALLLVSAGSLYLALVMHYSGFLFAAAFYIYGLTAALKDRWSRLFWLVWFASGCGVAALFAFFYRTHLARLPKTAMAAEAMQGWMRNSYYHPGHDHVLTFSLARTGGVFQFIFGQLAVGDVVFIGFIAAIVLLVRRTSSQGPARWRVATLFVTPLVINATAAVEGLYPYGGTRHSVFIAPIIFAATGFLIARIFRQRMAPAIITALLIVAIAALFGNPHQPYMTRSGQGREHMIDAVNFIEHRVPSSATVLVDYESDLLTSHYLCHEQPVSFDHSVQSFEQFDCGGVHVIAAFPEPMIFSAESFARRWQQFASVFKIAPGQEVWLIQAGWDVEPAAGLIANQNDPHLRLITHSSYGPDVAISQLNVTGK